MEHNNYDILAAEIDSLPSGGVTYKKINGKRYAYYQWRENGKQRSRRVKPKEEEQLLEQIKRRKELQRKLKGVNYYVQKIEPVAPYQLKCMSRLGKELDNFVKPVLKYKKRGCYCQLKQYIFGETNDKVFVLFGLRRTGKTTLIRQAISEMSSEMKAKCAFIQIREKTTLSEVNQDLKYLEKQGYKYVYIDEVTLLDDFIEGAALFSDIFASSGMKIVLSGTDSLRFIFAGDQELYDRCMMLHTTFISYGEFENVLDVHGVDNFIQYGGTMCVSGQHYNDSIFNSPQTTDDYINSAIAKNIQNSLKNYDYAGHFRSLEQLFKKNELTNVINRVVEDINHQFTLDVLTRDFKSHDLGVSANNLRKDKVAGSDVLDSIDVSKVTNQLKDLLEIKNKSEQTVELQDAHCKEIKEYLDLLDLTVDIEVRWMTDFNHKDFRTVFTQPGLRFSQAKMLIKALLNDDTFRKLSLQERTRIADRILSEVKGRMMEDIVALETKKANNDAEVFRLQFAVGEIDMIVFYPEKGQCEIFEVKHSTQRSPEQYKHLLDSKKCEEIEFRYGPIVGKHVIYRGESCCASELPEGSEITYLNVEQYLKDLSKKSDCMWCNSCI